MKKLFIIICALFLVSQSSFSRSSLSLYSTGNNVNWSNPSSWSFTAGGQSCMLIPQSNDSVFITSDISLDMDFSLSNGGYLFINSVCSLTSSDHKLTLSENCSFLCNGNMNIQQLEAGALAQVKIGTSGDVRLLNDFINNSALVSVDGKLEVGGTLVNNNQQGISSISGKGTITSGTFSGNGSIFGITNISLIPLQSSISECTWTGWHSNDWSDSLNWSYNRLPEPEQHISILASQTFAPSINAVASCNSLIVNPGASIVISQNGALTVNGDLTVANGGELRIKAGDSSHGSIITMGKSSGNIVFEYNVLKNRHCDVSSPISDAQSSVFLNMYLREYDEPSAGWGQYIVPTNVALGVMQGYEVFSTYSDTREFIGEPNSGENQINISTSGDGWNFIGNPYPSSLNWGSEMEPANGWSRDDAYGAIYYWDNTANGNKGNYAVYCPGGNGIGTNGGSRIILPSQGFFVKAKKSGSIRVNDNARVHASTNAQNGNNSLETSTLRLVARGNAMWDESVLQFNDNATNGFDSELDALKLSGNEEAPSLFTKLDDGTEISINSLPTSSLSGDIPIGFSCGKAGTFTLELHGLNTMNPELPIYLIDTKNNTLINLRNDSSYVFDYKLNDSPMRFLLHFSSPNGIDQVEGAKPSVYFSAGFINVELGSSYANSSIDVLDLAGRQVAVMSETSQGLNRISFNGKTGYYIIKITDHKQTYTTKLWIY
jgi:hypothetical protein